MRYDEGIAAAHRIMELGWLGEITALTISVNIWTEWRNWPWMQVLDELEIWVHSIHYHDTVRFFLGEPGAASSAPPGAPQARLPRARDGRSRASRSRTESAAP